MKNDTSAVKAILFCIGFGAYYFYRSLKAQKQLLQVEDTPKSKCSSAPQGLTELEGFAWPTEQTAPTISGKQAVYYELLVQKYESRGGRNDSSGKWVTVYSYEYKPNFYLVDATGLIEIDPTDADLEMLEKTTRLWVKLSQSEKEIVVNSYVKDNVPRFPPSEMLWGILSARYRIVEQTIFRGSPLVAGGEFRTLSHHPAKLKSKGLTWFGKSVFDYDSRGEKDRRAFLDKDHDGKVSEDEMVSGYSLIGAMAEQKTELEKIEETEFTVHGLLSKSANHKLWFAASRRNTLSERLRFQPIKMLAGGAALLAIGVTLGIAYFNGNLDSKVLSSPRSVKRAVATSNNSAVVGNLHRACVARSVDACRSLIKHADDFAVTPEYKKYYMQQACYLGAKEHCQ